PSSSSGATTSPTAEEGIRASCSAADIAAGISLAAAPFGAGAVSGGMVRAATHAATVARLARARMNAFIRRCYWGGVAAGVSERPILPLPLAGERPEGSAIQRRRQPLAIRRHELRLLCCRQLEYREHHPPGRVPPEPAIALDPF